MWKASAHCLGPAGQLLRPPVLGQVVHVTPETPKRRVDRAVLGACQRCSPLPQTYGKSAGMIGGRGGHFCDIRFWSVHMKLAPTTNSGARFCGQPVGARIDARRSEFRSLSFRARSRGLKSLGSFKRMVSDRRALKNGSNRGIFRDPRFCGAMARVCGRL